MKLLAGIGLWVGSLFGIRKYIRLIGADSPRHSDEVKIKIKEEVVYNKIYQVLRVPGIIKLR